MYMYMIALTLIYTARDSHGLRYVPRKPPLSTHESPFGLPHIGGLVHDQWGEVTIRTPQENLDGRLGLTLRGS